ncbi:MAG TPA: response regulator, partial [Acidimicrobiales bacterium]
MGQDAGTIVVVEDDPNIADLVDMYLRREGFRVLQASDGRAGLALVDRDKPRLVILDIGLPGEMDGLDVCRRLRAVTGIPVLMLTARDGEI